LGILAGMKGADPLIPSLTLLSQVGAQDGDAAEMPYQHIIKRIRQAQQSVEVHMYVWRDDRVGNWVGQALYEAAERGVKVKIFKDSGAVLFESQESNRKPFFETPRDWGKRLMQWGIGFTFPNSRVRDDWGQDLGRKLRQHPHVELVWVAPTHTKYYCIDERYLITGSLNLEDRHRGYHDVMVELSGETSIQHFRQTQNNSEKLKGVIVGQGRLHVLWNEPEREKFLIKSTVLRLIHNAQKTIHLEMAYVGDDEVTQALIDAGNRGVEIRILFSKKSNIGNDVNYHVLQHLMKMAPVSVRLSSKMIHSKIMVVDENSILLGSANFSVFSMQRAGELCLLSEGVIDFNRVVLDILNERWSSGVQVHDVRQLPHYWKTLACLQQWYQRVSRHK
jgi:cardiolipin synthase